MDGSSSSNSSSGSSSDENEPASPTRRKKRVVFADDRGLSLTQVSAMGENANNTGFPVRGGIGDERDGRAYKEEEEEEPPGSFFGKK